ncbi:uncharacterized protein LOC122639106 [Telopea speciosissima]|uniref:uncharacterized protein LOC122639106 n=1 Tax=Telopea speciosissima TaxID=54955 RepID=UPI001CC806FD|nr:uncharacterized protein LOC122639106 [Telopea speciosissima]
MEGDYGVKYMFQKLNDLGGKSGDQAMNYMSEKVKAIGGMEGDYGVKNMFQKLNDLGGKNGDQAMNYMTEKVKAIGGMEGDYGVKNMFEKLNDLGGKNGDQAMNYMSEKVKAVRGIEGEKILQYLMEKLHKIDEILPERMKNATLQDWIIWVVVALTVALLIRICYCCFPCLCRIFFKMMEALVLFISRCFCFGGRSAFKMMKAPGTIGIYILRAPFGNNPAAYFRLLRAGAPVGHMFRPCTSMV